MKAIRSPHHKHELQAHLTKKQFLCKGCKEVGLGDGHRCGKCNLYFHEECALPPPTIPNPFSKKREFRFHQQRPGRKERVCDACDKDALGFVYRCQKNGYNLHPCCAKLPPVLEVVGRKLDLPIELDLRPKLSRACCLCGEMGRGWCYRSRCKRYTIHVSCVKHLVENYRNADKNKKRGVRTKNEDKNEGRERPVAKIPNLGGMMANHHNVKVEKIRKICRIACGAACVIIKVFGILGTLHGVPADIIAHIIADPFVWRVIDKTVKKLFQKILKRVTKLAKI